LKIDIKVRKGGLITPDNFDTGVVKAVFPDGVVCELDGDDRPRKLYKYSLKIRVRKGIYEEKDGFCTFSKTPPQIPLYASNPVIIEFDEDDDATTPNEEIATGTFNP
jgi:hypothetical protein